MLCHRLAKPTENLCNNCPASFTRAWCAGDRREGLRELIDRYKFERTRAAHAPLAALLDATLPSFPADITVVSVPTIAPHIRIRGYDHAALIARQFARLRGHSYTPSIVRASNTVQRGAGRKQRFQQVKQAFAAEACNGRYLLIDDISTTGATLEYASRALLNAGADEVWVAVVAAQPLEK